MISGSYSSEASSSEMTVYTVRSEEDRPLRGLSPMDDLIDQMPRLSRKSIRIVGEYLDRLAPNEPLPRLYPEHFVREVAVIDETISAFERAQSERVKRQCQVIARGALNALCLAPAVAATFAPYPAVWMAAGAGGVLYLLFGKYNAEEDRSYLRGPQETVGGMLCGPCFAVHEAYREIPSRIAEIGELVEYRRDLLRSDFKDLHVVSIVEVSDSMQSDIEVLKKELEDCYKGVELLAELKEEVSSEEVSLKKMAFSLLEKKREYLHKTLIEHTRALQGLKAFVDYVNKDALKATLSEAMERG